MLLNSVEEVFFNQTFERYGGIYPLNSETNFSNFFDLTLVKNLIHFTRVKYPKTPKIIPGFISNSDLNAYSVKKVDDYYLGINIGTYTIIYDLFTSLLSSRNVLSEIGDSNKETQLEKKVCILSNNGYTSFDVENCKEYKRVLDPTRQKISSLYNEWVRTFLIFHEICHILRGHNGYLSSISSKFEWSEFNLYDKPAFFSSLDSQTFEMDADSFATNCAFNQGRHFLITPNERPKGIEFVFESYKSFLSHWVYAIYSFFRISGLQSFKVLFDESKCYNYSHPPAPVRLSMIFSNLIPLLQNNRVEDISGITNEILKSIQKAEDNFTQVSYSQPASLNFFQTFVDSQSYVGNIFNNWNKVRPLIEPFSFGELPPLVNN